MTEVFRLKQHFFIHVLDNNTNVTRCVVGPAVFTRKDHEKVLFAPRPCVLIPPRCFCRIRNPHFTDPASGAPVLDDYGQVKLNIGETAILFGEVSAGVARDPFPLMPGEVLVDEDPIKKLTVVPAGSALRIRAERDFTDAAGTERRAGDEWMFEGPQTYVPRIEEEVARTVRATIIKPNSALRLRATRQFTDRTQTPRLLGEEWLVKTPGAFLPAVEEEIVAEVHARVLTDRDAVHLEASRTFTDVFRRERRAGERWLITNADAATHIPDVYEKVLCDVKVTTLDTRQYCVVVDPVDPNTRRNRFGEMEVRRGEASFFLHPGERLRNGVEQIMVLAHDEAALLRAVEAYDDNGTQRRPGERWMISGPVEYIPPVQVQLVERRKAIALDENEGVYVRNETTGEVRAVIGQACMLRENETLWEKELPPIVEELLKRPNGMRHRLFDTDNVSTARRDKTRVVRFNVQHNAAVQIYDYKLKKPRVVFGPDVVMLNPDEEFTVLSCSGDKPKVPNVVQSLQLFLGPDFSSDIVVVETSDHARLQLALSYNWQFHVDRSSPATIAKLFSVPDFVGDFCKAIASRVRGAVAAVDFDSFHRHSAKIIRTAVFGVEDDHIKDSFEFTSNGMLVTNVDVKSVEPTDTKTRDSLQKSVQLAIEITTKSQEATARHDNDRKEQEAKGRLERQKLVDKIAAEQAKTAFLQLQAESAAVQAAGQAVAEAKARAESAIIEADSDLTQARLKSEAFKISAEGELEQLRLKQAAELEFTRRNNELELGKARELAGIEATKLASIMQAIGRETVVAMAQAGPEMQAKLLEGLGLKGYLITDGNSPINLFNTAAGMVGPGGAAAAGAGGGAASQ